VVGGGRQVNSTVPDDLPAYFCWYEQIVDNFFFVFSRNLKRRCSYAEFLMSVPVWAFQTTVNLP